MNKTLEQLVLIGYEAHRSELQNLIRMRLSRDTNFVELFEKYRSTHAKDLVVISKVDENMLENLGQKKPCSQNLGKRN